MKSHSRKLLGKSNILLKLLEQSLLFTLSLSVFITMSCSKGGGGGGENPPPPPPPPPVTFATSLNLVSPLPAEFQLSGEIAASDPNLNSAVFSIPTLPEERLTVGLVNTVQMAKEENQHTGTNNQTSQFIFDIRIAAVEDDEYTISKTPRTVQSQYAMGGRLSMAPSEADEDTYYRDELSQVYSHFRYGYSVQFVSNPMTAQTQIPTDIQLQYCYNSTQSMPQSNDYLTRYYVGTYHSPLGGPDVPAYTIRNTALYRLTCQSFSMTMQNMNYGYPMQAQQPGGAPPDLPPPQARLGQPNTAAPAPNTKEIQINVESVFIYVPRALVIAHYEEDLNGIFPLFRSNSVQIVGGAVLNKETQFIQAPTF